MPLTKTTPVVVKGFINTVKPALQDAYAGRRGIFLISFEYVSERGTTKEILSNKFVTSSTNLVDTLEALSLSFGNFHLNYVIDTGIFQVFSTDTKEADALKHAFSTFLTKHNQQSGTKAARGFIRQEFSMLRKQFCRKENADVLFVNDNVYRDFVAVM